MWRLFVTAAFVLILAGGTIFVAEAGGMPWIFGLTLAGIVLVLAGVVVRQRRGTRTPLAVREPRTKLHTRDLETNPPPKAGED